MTANPRRRLLQGLLAAGLSPLHARAQGPTPAPSAATGRLVFGIPPGAAGTRLAEAMLAGLAQVHEPVLRLDHVLGREARRSVEQVKAAAPDGTTLLHCQSAPVTLFPALYRRLGYTPLEDLTPLGALAEYAQMLVVGPQVPAAVRTLDDYLRWVRDNPTDRQVGVVLKGSQGFLAVQALQRARDASFIVTSYGGSTPMVKDLLAGALPAGVLITGNAQADIAAGRLRVLAVTSLQRWPGLPEVPTLAEQGVSGLDLMGWYGWFGPANLPSDLQQRLSTAIQATLAMPTTAAVIEGLQMKPLFLGPRELRERMVVETAIYAKLVQAAQIKPLDS